MPHNAGTTLSLTDKAHAEAWVANNVAALGLIVEAGEEPDGSRWVTIRLPEVSVILSSDFTGGNWAAFADPVTEPSGAGKTLTQALAETAAVVASRLF